VNPSYPWLLGRRTSRSGARVAGWTLFTILLVAAPALFAGASVVYASAISRYGVDSSKHGTGDIMVGSGVACIVLGLLMLIPALLHDDGSVTPGNMARDPSLEN
jgi:hypothetical protein